MFRKLNKQSFRRCQYVKENNGKSHFYRVQILAVNVWNAVYHVEAKIMNNRSCWIGQFVKYTLPRIIGTALDFEEQLLFVYPVLHLPSISIFR